MRNIAIFASGSGSNFEAIVKAVHAGEISAEVLLLICDKPGAYVITRAQNLGIPVFTLSPKTYADKSAYEREILAQLQSLDIEFIVLAGYMRLIGETLLEAYPNKIVNIHPSKLPDYTGKDAIARAFHDGKNETGVTVHFVDEGMDTGEIIAQETVAVSSGETLEQLEEKIHKVEHKLYVKTLANLFAR